MNIAPVGVFGAQRWLWLRRKLGVRGDSRLEITLGERAVLVSVDGAKLEEYKVLATVVQQACERSLLSDKHFTVDGTLLEAADSKMVKRDIATADWYQPTSSFARDTIRIIETPRYVP